MVNKFIYIKGFFFLFIKFYFVFISSLFYSSKLQTTTTTTTTITHCTFIISIYGINNLFFIFSISVFNIKKHTPHTLIYKKLKKEKKTKLKISRRKNTKKIVYTFPFFNCQIHIFKSLIIWGGCRLIIWI